jgi:BASS family bile acid:Na+ symporter
VIVLLVAIGMNSRLRDIRFVLSRPGFLLRAIVAMYVLVPLLALACVWFVDLPAGLGVALLVIAISAGAPLLPRKLTQFGHDEYAFGLVVITSLLAIVTVPAELKILGAAFDREVTIVPLDIARVVATSFFAPLLAGIVVGRVIPERAPAVSDWMTSAAGLLLAICSIALLVLNREILLAAGWLPMLVLTVLAACALAIGHLCGGPHPDGRSMLAVACATRHVGLAILVATSIGERRAATLVAAYVVAAVIVTVPYVRWRRRAST